MAVSIGQTSLVSDGLVLHLDPSVTYNYILSEVETLVVAGGGGGGGWGGGGGGGGVVYNRLYPVTPGTAISITIGNGGTPGTSNYTSGGDGGNSIFGNITAIGGGGGGHYNSVNGRAGGSGGGGGGSASVTYGFVTTGGSGTPGQGFNGGRGGGLPDGNYYNPGGGGGGAGERGYDFDVNIRLGGKGGDGLPFNISGRLRYYGGGGGGHTDGRTNTISNSYGGKGGGGRGGNYGIPRRGLDGAANTGGGGGGSYGTSAGSECGTGGTGVVIVRYLGPPKATGGNTITQVDGYTIHTFTTSGTFTPSSAPANSGAINGLQDLSGNYNTGTITTGVTYNTANGGVLNFDGGDASHIQIVNTAGQVDFPGDFTVGLWIYPTQYHRTYQTMIDTYPGGATNGWIFTTMNNTSQAISWYTEGSAWQQSGAAVTLNAWNYVVASRIGTTVKLYKNATEIHSHSDSTNIRGGLGRIGRGLSDGNEYGNVFGRISVVQIYKGKGLTATEISQNFNALRGRFGI